MPAPFPIRAQLQARLTDLKPLATRLATIAYRSTTPRSATEHDLLTGVGSQQYGGRWNPVGLAAVYASLTPKTAMAATLAHHRYDNRPLQQFMPRTFVAMEVQLRLVLDLGDGGVCQRLRVSLRRLLGVEPVGPMKLPRSQSEFDPRRDRMRRVQSAPVPDLGESMPRSDQA